MDIKTVIVRAHDKLFIVGLIGAVVGVILGYLIVVNWEYLNANHESFRSLFIALAAIIGLPLVIWRTFALAESSKAAGQQAAIARDANITDRFTRAIEQLGSERLDIRLGGIYALEKIAHQEKEYHPQIIEVLTATVRVNARWGNKSDDVNPKPSVDIQAILTVIGRRESSFDKGVLDLSHTDLRGATLSFANLARAHLYGTHLEGARMLNADLSRAAMSAAHLEGAWLFHVNLERAMLIGAYFEGADVGDANLRETDVRRCEGLTCEQLGKAKNWELAFRDEQYACGEAIPEWTPR